MADFEDHFLEDELLPRLEALLFVASAPASVNQLASALQVNSSDVERALKRLGQLYQGRGIRLQESREGIQLTSAPECAKDIERFLELESTNRMTRASLEVLAIIAYEQPVTRPQIDAIRGVNSDSALKTLLRYGLIEEVGRSPTPGRPILYETTPEFLQQFGLGSLQELPPLVPEELPKVPEETGETALIEEGSRGESRNPIDYRKSSTEEGR